MLKKIISGGQSGADQGALYAALRLGLETGGWAPPGFMTEYGRRPELLGATFKLQEHVESVGLSMREQYRARTIKNILDSDVTFVFDEVGSPGSQLTYTQAELHKKPVCKNPSITVIRFYANKPEVTVINVAGNRESVTPGMHGRVYQLLLDALLPAEVKP